MKIKRFEVTLTANLIVTVVAKNKSEAIKIAEALPRAEQLKNVTSVGFDYDSDIVTNMSRFKSPEGKALYHLRKMGINLTKRELRQALKRVAEGIKKQQS